MIEVPLLIVSWYGWLKFHLLIDHLDNIMYGFFYWFFGDSRWRFCNEGLLHDNRVMIKLQFINSIHVNNLKTGEKVQD